MPLPPPDEHLQLRHVREDLMREFPDLPPAVVDLEVRTLAASFTGAPVRTFIPVLVRRGARNHLRDLL